MGVTTKVLVPAKVVESAQTTQYTATNVKAMIDKFTATNFGAVVASISVNLVSAAGTTGNQNLIIKAKTLQPGESFLFPQVVGHVLDEGDFISTLASAANTINIRVSGREIS